MKRCEQIKCGFYLAGGCQSCQECNAEPYNINQKCSRCISCEQEEGELRWGEKSNKLKNEGIIIIGKVM